MKKAIQAIIKTYGKDKERLGQMLRSIINYLSLLDEPEMIPGYMDGSEPFPINKTGNKFYDASIKEIQNFIRSEEKESNVSKELKSLATFMEKEIISKKLIPGYTKAAKGKTAPIEPEKEKSAPMPKGEINLKSLNDAFGNAKRIKMVLDQKPLNPVHIPSMINNVNACIKNLEMHRDLLLGKKA